MMFCHISVPCNPALLLGGHDVQRYHECRDQGFVQEVAWITTHSQQGQGSSRRHYSCYRYHRYLILPAPQIRSPRSQSFKDTAVVGTSVRQLVPKVHDWSARNSCRWRVKVDTARVASVLRTLEEFGPDGTGRLEERKYNILFCSSTPCCPDFSHCTVPLYLAISSIRGYLHLILSFTRIKLIKPIKSMTSLRETSWIPAVPVILQILILIHEVKLTEKEKNRKLNDLLDALEFNQVDGQSDCLTVVARWFLATIYGMPWADSQPIGLQYRW